MIHECWQHRGKIPYLTQRNAELAKAAMRKSGRSRTADLSAFACDECHLWFLGSKSAAKRYRRERIAKRSTW